MPINCVQCGFCCEQGACSHGEWDSLKNRCAHLSEPDKNGCQFCNKYQEIKEKEGEHSFRMFGGGCSSRLFNEQREAVARNKGII